jgi:DNA-binding NarL/FixJ family response regulator
MKILLVDDHTLFRAGLRMLLAHLQENLTIFEGDSSEEALALAAAHPDLVLCLLDLTLNGGEGLMLIPQLRAVHPSIVIVVVSADESHATSYRCLDAGAMGYIPKSVSVAVMTQALKLVLAGGIYLPAALLESRHAGESESRHAPVLTALTALTVRQHQVLQCLLRGWPNKLISRHLCLSENTVKTHLSAIYRALQVCTRAQAVIAARKLGISPEFDLPAPSYHE